MFGDSTTSGPSVAASHRPLSKLSGCIQLTKHHPGFGGNPLRECIIRIGSGVKVAACLVYRAHRGVQLGRISGNGRPQLLRRIHNDTFRRWGAGGGLSGDLAELH